MYQSLRILAAGLLAVTSAFAQTDALTNRLHSAGRSNNLKGVQDSLVQGADVNATDNTGATALFYAVAAKNQEMAAWLLEQGASADMQNAAGRSPVAQAAQLGDIEMLKLLAAHGGDLQKRYWLGRGEAAACLHIAVRNNDMKLAQYLLSEKVSTETRNSEAQSPLMLAAAMDNPAMVRLLIENGAYLYADRSFGGSLLDSEMFAPPPRIKSYLQQVEQQRTANITEPAWTRCLKQENDETVIDLTKIESYLQSGGDPTGADKIGRTLLHYVAESYLGNVYQSKIHLLEELAADPRLDINAQDIHGQTALHLTCRHDQVPNAKILLDHGAAVDIQNYDDSTPLVTLARFHHSGVVGEENELEIAKLLLDKGAEVNATNAFGYTPLLYLAEDRMDRHLNFARLLIDHGAEVNAKNHEGNTFLHVAADLGTAAMMKLVIEAKADMNLRSYYGRSILDAVRYDSQEKYDLIFQYKQDTNVLQAVYYAQAAILDRLIQEGADINMTTDYDHGATGLIIAAKQNIPEIVKQLLALGADINKTDQLDCTALHYAAELGHDDIVWQLLQGGADVNIRSKEGRLAAQLAKTNNRYRVLQLFKDYYQAGQTAQPQAAQAKAPAANTANTAKTETAGEAVEEITWDLDRVEPRLSRPQTLQRIKAYLPKTSKSLHSAVIRGQLKQINQLLILGADVNETDEMGMLPLGYAVLLDNLPVVTLLLQKGADVNRLDANGMFWEMLGIMGWGHTVGTEAGWGPLHYTTAAGSHAMLDLLIQQGADVNLAEKETQKTPIFMAIERDRPHMLKTLLEAGADLKHMDKNGETLFHSMARRGKIDYLKLLMEMGVEVDTPDRSGNTALMTAARMGEDDVMIFLLENGADVSGLKKIFASTLAASYTDETLRILVEYGVDVNTKNASGKPPLFSLFDYGSDWSQVRKKIQMLLDSGIDVNACNNDGDTVLHYAARGGDSVPIEFAEFMIEQGVDVDRPNNKGETALQVLLNFGSPNTRSQRLALMLAQNTTDVNRVDRYGRNTLHQAAMRGLPEVVAVLASKGADLNNRENDMPGGKTPLHSAIAEKQTEAVRALLEAGADLSAGDKRGQTPLFTAIHSGNADILQLLLDNGVDVNGLNKNGSTALHTAVGNQKQEIVQWLLKAGARTDIPDRNGFTAADLARRMNNPEMAALFQQ